MLGVSLGTSGLGGIAAGGLADRLGKRTVLACTIMLYSVGSLICGLSPDYGVFLFGRGIVGLGVGGEWAIGHAMVAEAIGSRRRGLGSSMLQTGEPVGMLLAATGTWSSEEGRGEKGEHRVLPFEQGPCIGRY
jgi:MFS family permease